MFYLEEKIRATIEDGQDNKDAPPWFELSIMLHKLSPKNFRKSVKRSP